MLRWTRRLLRHTGLRELLPPAAPPLPAGQGAAPAKPTAADATIAARAAAITTLSTLPTSVATVFAGATVAAADPTQGAAKSATIATIWLPLGLATLRCQWLLRQPRCHW